MYHKARIHNGPQKNCKLCMSKIAQQDSAFAEQISHIAQDEKARSKKKESYMRDSDTSR